MFKTKYNISDGDVFGSWTVLKSNIYKSFSLVKCVCGKEKNVRNSDLFTGRSSSCGKKVCYSDFQDLNGKKFGFWTVLKMTDDRYSNGTILWECQCICGNINLLSSSKLINGETKSCGCKKINFKLETQPILSKKERVVNKLYNQYKYGAVNRGLDFNLDKIQFSNLVFENCHYCGTKPKQIIFIKRYLENIVVYSNGIDRKNPKQGYYLDNCVSCCWICNRAKLDMKYEEFIQYLNQLVYFRNSLDIQN